MERVPAKWKAADGSEHVTQTDVLKHEGLCALKDLLTGVGLVEPASIAAHLSSNADAVIAMLKPHATKRARKPKLVAVQPAPIKI
jgi:hypothetical protein